MSSTAEDYNKLPYRSVAYAASSPEQLSAVARLFGQEPPNAETAWVLEFGCASGGNLLPLAIKYPEGRFVGVDLSERQIADAQARVDALGLTNIQFHHGDLSTMSVEPEVFDYVIAHGVYSWIPSDVQDAMLRITRSALKPGGLAYISYNTYPGWNMRSTVRDICMYHASTETDPEARVSRARWIMDKLGQLPDRGVYNQLLKQEAELNVDQDDSYILGEFLADNNRPCYFYEFAQRTLEHGLSYLCEAEIVSSLPEALDYQSAQIVREIAGDSGLALEQYMDFFIGRQFRSSVLMRPVGDAPIARSLVIGRLLDLHLESSWLPGEGEREWKTGKKSRQLSPVSHAVLTSLHNVFPGTVPVTEIVEMLRRDGHVTSQDEASEALGEVFKLTLMKGVDVVGTPRSTGRATDEMPEVCPLARVEAAAGQEWLSTRRHGSVRSNPKVVGFVPIIDGTRSFDTLAEIIERGIRDGRVVQKTSEDSPEAAARLILSDVLRWLERMALLVPQSTN